MTWEHAPQLLICNLKSKLIIYKQSVLSSVPLQLTEEAPHLVFQSLLCSLLRTVVQGGGYVAECHNFGCTGTPLFNSAAPWHRSLSSAPSLTWQWGLFSSPSSPAVVRCQIVYRTHCCQHRQLDWHQHQRVRRHPPQNISYSNEGARGGRRKDARWWWWPEQWARRRRRLSNDNLMQSVVSSVEDAIFYSPTVPPSLRWLVSESHILCQSHTSFVKTHTFDLGIYSQDVWDPKPLWMEACVKNLNQKSIQQNHPFFWAGWIGSSPETSCVCYVLLASKSGPLLGWSWTI